MTRMGSLEPASVGGVQHHQSRTSSQVIVLSVFLNAVGNYLLVPILPIVMLVTTRAAPAAVGAILSLSFLTSRCLALPGGLVADHIGAKRTMLLGLLLNALGCTMLALASASLHFVAGVVAFGIGTALVQPSSKSLTVSFAADARLAEMFAWRMVALNVGVVVSAGLTVLFVTHSLLRLAFVVPAVLYGCVALAVAAAIPARVTAPPLMNGHRRRTDVAAALCDRRLVRLLVCSALFWFLQSQLNVAVPLELNARHWTRFSGVVFALIAGVAIITQIPLIRAARRIGLTLRCRLALGIALTGIGLGVIDLWDVSWLFVPLFASLFAVGEVLGGPASDTIASLIASPRLVATYLGLASVSAGVGGGLGSLVAGLGYQIGSLSRFWLALLLFGVLMAMPSARIAPTVGSEGDRR